MSDMEYLKEFKKEAKNIDDKNNTLIYVSTTVSDYMRRKIQKLIKLEVEFLDVDLELGIISKEQYDSEKATLNLIYKSLWKKVK